MSDKYKELLELLLGDIDNIDKDTPWSNIEPEWWLMMMTLRVTTLQHLKKLKEIK